jgi:hypothetical protein
VTLKRGKLARQGGDHGRRGGKRGVSDGEAGLPAASRCVRQHKGEHAQEKARVCVACKAGALGLGRPTRGGDMAHSCAVE